MDLSKWAMSGILLALSLLMMCVEEGLSIKCYTCNSHKYPACMDNPTSLMGSNETYGECQMGYNRCRKIFQEVGDTTSVVRQCAKEGSVGCLQRTGTYKIKMEYCECDTDGCNSAPGLMSSAVIVTIVAMFTLFRSLLV